MKTGEPWHRQSTLPFSVWLTLLLRHTERGLWPDVSDERVHAPQKTIVRPASATSLHQTDLFWPCTCTRSATNPNRRVLFKYALRSAPINPKIRTGTVNVTIIFNSVKMSDILTNNVHQRNDRKRVIFSM